MNKIEVENSQQPGKITRVDAAKYKAMKAAYLQVLPDTSPGLNIEEIYQAILLLLPESLFPKGKAVTMWIKIVQLDLEAKKLVTRAKTKPLRWYKADDQN
ncbi:MAG: hypothetical protein KC422_10415 [Trueperaceae bacterium]|nr:hypothetical protein [Trueperaceae bacterium]